MAPWNATGRCTVLDDERAVQVQHDGAWVDGWVTAQRRDPDGWWALVRYHRRRDAVPALAAGR